MISRFGLLAAAVPICALLSLSIGQRSDVGLHNIMSLILFDDGSLARSAVMDLRLPRTLVAGLVGANLGLAGLGLQAITRNPLASESILGINQGAALAVAIGLVWPAFMVINLDVMAAIGAIVAGLLTFGLAGGFAARLDAVRLILAGVAVGAFSFAMVRFAFTLEDNLARAVLSWVAADISSSSFFQVIPLALWLGLGLTGTILLAHSFDLLALGEGASQSLGSNPQHLRLVGALLAALLTGAAVAAAGPVMFVGLVVPHWCRVWFGQFHRALVPAVALGGAAFVMAADAVSKLINFPFETPLGIVCALIGAPYFLYITLRTRHLV